jgi:hypothetical protein
VDEGTRFLDCRWRFRVGRTMTVGIDPQQLMHLDQGFDALIAAASTELQLPLAALAAQDADAPAQGRLGVVGFDAGRENRLARLDRVIPGI